ncbi:MAG TPA: SUF system Fe-S cluster assembly protein [Vicinamibacterales bacterium]|nr:SUF system Fe-S cluster assembly protein [Vicinamibacterales bacterium]
MTSEPWDFGALTPPAAADVPKTGGMTNDPIRSLTLKPLVIETLSSVYDPEIPVNIYELGLIYDVIIDAQAAVGIRMTLTAPACPAAQSLPAEVEHKLRQIPGVTDVRLDIVWDPPWDKDRMSDEAKLQLGIF